MTRLKVLKNISFDTRVHLTKGTIITDRLMRDEVTRRLPSDAWEKVKEASKPKSKGNKKN